MGDVGVGEQQQLDPDRARRLHTALDGVELAGPPWRRGRGGQHGQRGSPTGPVGEGTGQLGRAVAARVVDQPHRELARVVLGEQRGQGLGQYCRLVARRDHDSDARPAGGLRRVGGQTGRGEPETAVTDEQVGPHRGRRGGERAEQLHPLSIARVPIGGYLTHRVSPRTGYLQAPGISIHRVSPTGGIDDFSRMRDPRTGDPSGRGAPESGPSIHPKEPGDLREC